MSDKECQHCGWTGGEKELCCSDEDEQRYVAGAKDVPFNICPLCECQSGIKDVEAAELKR